MHELPPIVGKLLEVQNLVRAISLGGCPFTLGAPENVATGDIVNMLKQMSSDTNMYKLSRSK